MTARLLLAALLALLPVPAARRTCINARRESIIARADEAARVHRVPVAVLLVIAYLESHIGCAPRSGGCWGAPISPTRRDVAGGAAQSAAALAWGYRACTTTLGAISHYRCGRCTCPHLIGYQPSQAVDLIDRVNVRALAMGGPTP